MGKREVSIYWFTEVLLLHMHVSVFSETVKNMQYLMNACRSKTTQKLHSQHYVSLNDKFPVLGDIMSSKITNNRTEEDH